MPWALGRTVIMVRHTGELGKAVLSEPDRFIPDLPAFARQWTTAREAYAVFAVRDFDSLRNALALPMQEVARGPRYVVVRKP